MSKFYPSFLVYDLSENMTYHSIDKISNMMDATSREEKAYPPVHLGSSQFLKFNNTKGCSVTVNQRTDRIMANVNW
jgi:hypothetical protein